ncbi:IgGFc-binding protein-like [Rhineura floridana]|uniref:IgGFc-binding protein-like n=1 Tax=Rhineura floridana TaxID=261503 RepID=UPI002AC89245|nr:IgGFc-binding protein-like [Rhineura floridana]
MRKSTLTSSVVVRFKCQPSQLLDMERGGGAIFASGSEMSGVKPDILPGTLYGEDKRLLRHFLGLELSMLGPGTLCLRITCLGGSLGTQFITSYMQNFEKEGRFELQITGYYNSTTVTVSVPCDLCRQEREFERRINVDRGKMVQVELPKFVEIIDSKVFSHVVQIQADKNVSVVSLSSKPFSADTALLYPVNSLGNEHYIVAPVSGPVGALQEFAILTPQGPNVVDVYPTSPVTFNRKTYTAGSKLSVTLKAFTGVQLQGKGDLSGTKIVSQLPVAVLSGHICSWKNTKCNHVFEQLLPVSKWGKTFVVPPMPWQTKSDILYVSASQATVLTYQTGAAKQTVNLGGGKVRQISVLPKSPIYLSANAPVQVFLYSTGAAVRTFTYDTFLMGIPDTEKYSLSYTINGQVGFQNFVLLVAKTSETGGLTVNGKPLDTVKWSLVPGSEYSWSLYELPVVLHSYRVAHPHSPFCLFSVGIANMNSYGTPGAGVDIAPPLTCSSVLCRKGMVCKMINDQPHCVPSSEATCWAWGDPHYHTFDERNYDFQGTCTYTVAKTCAENFGLPSFHVFAKNENRGNKQVSYVATVTIEVYGYTITVIRSEFGFVRVNGILTHLPISLKDGNLQLLQIGTSVILNTDFQLKVSYDWSHHLRVTISSAYQEAVCGLCGNYNDDPTDDFETPAGTTAPSITAFGESWMVKTDDSLCWHDCHGPCRVCQSDVAKMYEAEAYCGLITKVSNGPFAPCHAKVSPTAYFDSCLYDLCSTEGNKQSLCDALKAYADACQREGAQIGDWRTVSGCLLECPPNSQYQSCGTACPATCVDDRTQQENFCPAVCVEGCQCNPGFVLSRGACIPKSSCGCVYEGRPYAPNESFWADDTCRNRCMCNPAKRVVECAASTCKPTERCQVVKGVQGCYPTGSGICTASGDPHYYTFDKYRFDFQGACAYVFAEVFRNTEGLEGFGIYVQNEHRGNTAVSWTRSVQINVYDIEIIVSRQYSGRALVGGLLTYLPYSTAGGRVRLYRRGLDAVTETDFGLLVTFNWDSQVSVTVPNTYANTLRGLCGNFNGNAADDALVPGGILIPNRPVFGTSGTEVIDPKCKEIVDPKCPGIEALADRQRASGKECGLLLAKDGPFRECHGQIDEEGAFQDCIYDYCFYKGRYAFMCAGIASYASACQAIGVTTYPWRSSTFCPPLCPSNSHYEHCARGCVQTCSSLYITPRCPNKCEEDCVCNEGFVMSSYTCVPMAQCGCFHQGRYYPALEYFYPTCEERCRCQAGGNVVCHKVPCGPNEECRIVEGYRKCYATGNATCSVVGSLYLSFDRRPIHFPGTCTYFLTKLHKPNEYLKPLAVVVKNEAWKNGKISVTKEVYVEVLDFQLILLRNKWGLVKVNGIFQRLPVNLLTGQLRIYQHGLSVRIDSTFGFALTYDLFYHVRVTIPNIYQGHMGGLCGNYNGQKSDDFQLPDGTVVTDVDVFGAAWKIPIPGVPCTDGCAGKGCPVCEEEKKEIFKQRRSCGLLAASDGPFSECHAVVNLGAYLENCITELCIGGDDQQALCLSLQSYTEACQEAGVNIQPWRSSTFCPITCPANSHYTICSNICETNCAGLTDHIKCPENCVEGCQCDDGFFFDGLKCIPLDECGCFEHGRYFPPNEPVLLNDCTERCICTAAGGLRCEAITCPAGETCEVKNGIMQCYSKAKECPENSHYEACGSACPATCADRMAPSACEEPCVETCQCDDGHVLSADKCVPVGSCGCTYNGLNYKPGEEFWADEKCSSRCTCDPTRGVVVCIPGGCKAGEECVVVNGVRGCHPSSPSTCTSSGCYYYTTFDGKNYEFKGTCIYQLVAVCSTDSTLIPFNISVQNSPAPDGHAVTLRVYDVSITLRADRGDKIEVNGNTMDLPFSHEGKIHVSSDESQFTIVTDFGLSVQLVKENLRVVASVPGNYAGSLCGLCGNANGDPSDDKMGESGETLRVGCSPGCAPDCPPCTLAEQESYQEDRYCGLLRQLNGPFASCHAANPYAPFFNECITKTCEVRGDKPIWCDVIAAYAAACQAKGFPIKEWRKDDFCCEYELLGAWDMV